MVLVVVYFLQRPRSTFFMESSEEFWVLDCREDELLFDELLAVVVVIVFVESEGDREKERFVVV